MLDVGNLSSILIFNIYILWLIPHLASLWLKVYLMQYNIWCILKLFEAIVKEI
jgi:hypothetical protein